jgi:WD40 repeat protein
VADEPGKDIPTEEQAPRDAPASEGAAALKPVLVLDTGGHTGTINKVLFSPDGKQVFTVASDKTVRVWDTQTGQPVRVLRPPVGEGVAGELYAGALSPDGKTLAVAGWGNFDNGKRFADVYLIGLADSQVRVLRKANVPIRALAFSAAGKYLAAGGNGPVVRIWDVAAGTCLHELRGHPHGSLALAFSPDGKRLATGGNDKTVRLWSVQTGKEEEVITGYPFLVTAVAWSPDGARVYASCFHDGSVHAWDRAAHENKPISVGGPGSAILDLTIKDENDLLATWRKHVGRQHFHFSVTHLDVAAGKLRNGWQLRQGSAATPMSTALSADGAWAATCTGEDLQTYLWAAADGQTVYRLGGPGRPIFRVGWSADGTAVAWGVPRQVGEHDPPLTAALRLTGLALDTKPAQQDYRGPQKTLGSLTVAELPKAQLAIKEKDRPEPLATFNIRGPYWAYTLLPGDRLAVGVGHEIRLFDIRKRKKLLDLERHADRVWSLAPSPDGRYLLSGSGDQTIRVYTLDRKEPLLSIFAAGTEWVAWTPEGYYAASAGGEKLMGWHVNNGLEALGTFYPASRFHASLYRPDVIERLLAEGSLDKALAAADKARGRAKSEATEVSEVLPPEVTLTAPGLKGNSVDEPDVEVEATARGKGKHPVTSLLLLLDGRPYEGSKGLRKVKAEPGAAVKERWRVTLTAGPHTLRVLARSAVSMNLSDELEVTYAKREPRPTLYVLAVGVNAYKERKLQLACAVNDAAGLEQTLASKSQALFDVKAKLLRNTQATKEGVLAGLKWLKDEGMKPHDVAVVFFAGHGEKDDKGRFYLLPQDVDVQDLAQTAISGEVLKQHLADLPGRVLLLLDACHSGAIGLGAGISDLARNLADEDCGVVVMCAALGSETAGEANGHGHFCQALIEGLQGKAAHNPRDGCIYLHHLEQYVIDRVLELSHDEQHPTTAKPTIRPLALAKP